MTEQPDLCQTCSETTLLVFPRDGSNNNIYGTCTSMAAIDRSFYDFNGLSWGSERKCYIFSELGWGGVGWGGGTTDNFIGAICLLLPLFGAWGGGGGI